MSDALPPASRRAQLYELRESITRLLAPFFTSPDPVNHARALRDLVSAFERARLREGLMESARCEVNSLGVRRKAADTILLAFAALDHQHAMASEECRAQLNANPFDPITTAPVRFRNHIRKLRGGTRDKDMAVIEAVVDILNATVEEAERAERPRLPSPSRQEANRSVLDMLAALSGVDNAQKPPEQAPRQERTEATILAQALAERIAEIGEEMRTTPARIPQAVPRPAPATECAVETPPGVESPRVIETPSEPTSAPMSEPDGPVEPCYFRWRGVVREFGSNEMRFYRLLVAMWPLFKYMGGPRGQLSCTVLQDQLKSERSREGPPPRTLGEYARLLSEKLCLWDFPAKLERFEDFIRWQPFPESRLTS